MKGDGGVRQATDRHDPTDDEKREEDCMPFHLPDPASPSGANIARQLHDEPLIWLTTVDAKGVPQPVPVWFLWDEATATLLVYSRASAKRLAHIQQNSNVALHLEASGGREVIVITGKALVSSDDPPADQVLPYVEKESVNYCV
jgi:PPOX class probable F420-dependent enzyme